MSGGWQAFAKALRSLPKTIAENGGYDSTELVTQLRAAHNKGQSSAGLNMNDGTIGDMKETGIIECFRVKCQVRAHPAAPPRAVLSHVLLRVTSLRVWPAPCLRDECSCVKCMCRWAVAGVGGRGSGDDHPRRRGYHVRPEAARRGVGLLRPCSSLSRSPPTLAASDRALVAVAGAWLATVVELCECGCGMKMSLGYIFCHSCRCTFRLRLSWLAMPRRRLDRS